MIPSTQQLTRNNVLNRFLPIPGTVLKGLESERPERIRSWIIRSCNVSPT